jgi:hypothetical protein
MDYSWKLYLIMSFLLCVVGSIGYLVMLSFCQWREDKKQHDCGNHIYEIDSNHNPPKSFIGPDGQKYRQDYDIDLRLNLTNKEL